MASPILWQNDEQTVTLIDVPRSIELAQGEDGFRYVLSTPPLQSPFPSNEPKKSTAKTLMEKNSVDTQSHAEYQTLVQAAIDSISENPRGPWCLPRSFTGDCPPPAKKRKMATGPTSASISRARPEDESPCSELPDDLLPHLARTEDSSGFFMESNGTEDKSNMEKTHTFSNLSNQPTSIAIAAKESDSSGEFHFRVPPQSSFYLGDVANPKPFRDAVYAAAQSTNTTSHFDCVILDPPWPNSSVQRTHKTPGSTYNTSPSMWDMRELLLDTKIEVLMAESCVVGIWITNKPVVRELVLGEEGIFACWDVELVEEWVWLKTTVHGEPVFPVDALWRKPYEVLLLGRKRRKISFSVNEGSGSERVKRRVLVSVPDLHSRKPCLKELLPPMMREMESYRVLEVFARHLVAGWWSWGNECLKFNWEGYWRERGK